jgi:hypothetical protein
MGLLNEIIQDQASYYLIDTSVGDGLFSTPENIPSSVDYKLLNGHHTATFDDFMEEVFIQFSFPDHFGRNWSAFADSLMERLTDFDVSQYFIVFTAADSLLSKEPTEQIGYMFDTMNHILIEVKETSDRVLKIIFLVENPKQSHLGNFIAQSHHGGRVIM